MKTLFTPLACALIVICFFAPWMSCGSLTVSGYDIASGAERAATVSTNGDQSMPLLWIVPISAILIAAAYISRRTGSRAIILLASIISTVVMAYKGFDVKDKYSESVHILWGFWMTVVGFIICMFEAIRSQNERD
jgi:hypothetical protein